jgi:uncharacterized protein YukE
MARAVVQSVLAQLMQQFNIVEDQGLQPMRMMVQQVTDGVWRGQGANAFVDEVSSLMIPGVGRVGENIQTVHSNLDRAVNVIDTADSQVNQMVSSRLVDTFNFY